MLSDLTLSIQAAAPADLATLILWVLVHAIVAGGLVGLARLLQRWTSCLPLVLGRIVVALILGVSQYLILRAYLPALGGLLWIGVTTLAGVLLIATSFIGSLIGNILWMLATTLLPRHWTAGRVGIERVLNMIGLASVFSALLGGSQRLLLQVYMPDAGPWLWATFFGSLVGLFPVYRLLPDIGEDEKTSKIDVDASNRRFAFRILLLEAAMLLGAGVATGLVLWLWFG